MEDDVRAMADDMRITLVEFSELWVTEFLDKLKALDEDPKVSRGMHVARLTEALANAWQPVIDQALEAAKGRMPPTFPREFFADAQKEYLKKNARPGEWPWPTK